MTDTPDSLPEPSLVEGLTLDALQCMAQNVEHCDTPMRPRRTNTTWTGQHGSGIEHITVLRICDTCGAALITTSNIPS